MFVLADTSGSRLTSMATAPPLIRTDSARGDFSPLKHFVVAKKTISDVFEQLLNYVKETSDFVEGETGCQKTLKSDIMSAGTAGGGGVLVFYFMMCFCADRHQWEHSFGEHCKSGSEGAD